MGRIAFFFIAICGIFAILLHPVQGEESTVIDRHALVTRHNPTILKPDPFAPLSVGNGEFAFTADITGLQTFPDFYRESIPLGTLSNWGWHTIPSDPPYQLDAALKSYKTYGRPVDYASQTKGSASEWLRANPHRLHLGQIGFHLLQSDGSVASIESLQNSKQILDLWNGILISEYELDHQPIRVFTCCHPQRDAIAVRVESPLIEQGRLSVHFDFPYGSDSWGPAMTDWMHPDRHQTRILHSDGTQVDMERILDADRYFVHVSFTDGSTWTEREPHRYSLLPNQKTSFEFTCEFSPTPITAPTLDFAHIRSFCQNHWPDFWQRGGAIDLSGSLDPRAHELERRIVLSQYLTAIQCSGSLPPQESGLTHNSWFGKFHLEMHWWHAVHFALWNRIALLEKSLPWYQKILPRAQLTAKHQGYDGARWPKMVGPDGRESPSSVGVFLIWQQPHPIYYAELCYRAHPNRETLETYKEIVFETADFMASYVVWDVDQQRYVLGPPLIPAQECYPPETTFNPTFELAYWSFALQRAQEWRHRLDLPPNEKWQQVIDRLSALPMKDGLYVTTESTLDTFTNPALRRDHPSLTGALGILPAGTMADPETMRRTLHKIVEDWNWESTWGWDYPMLAMTAARLGEGELAIDALLMDTPKNHYLPNGHCYQRPNLPTYLPANGGLLTAIAMMAAGWDGAPPTYAPGFPQNGK